MKRGFTIIELLILLLVVTAILLPVSYAYKFYSDYEYKSKTQLKFNKLVEKMEKSVYYNDKLIGVNLSWWGILYPGDTLEYDNLLYKNRLLEVSKIDDEDYGTLDDFLLTSEKSETKKRKQMDFWNISEDDSDIYGSKPLVIISYGEKISKDGVKFPYKIITVLDLGRKLYRGFRNLFNSEDGIIQSKMFLSLLLKKNSGGYTLNRFFDDMDKVVEHKIDNSVHLSTIKDIIKSVLGQNEEQAIKIWDKEKYNINIYNISTMKLMEQRVDNSVDNIKNIIKTIENLMLIESRKKVNDLENLENGDIDYFITCSEKDNHCGISGLPCIKLDTNDNQIKPFNSCSGKIDKSKTYVPQLNDDLTAREIEDSIGYGFIVCKSDGERCSNNSIPTLTSGDVFDCVDNNFVSVGCSSGDLFYQVEGAVPIDNMSSSEHTLGRAIKNVIIRSNSSKNGFGGNIYFSNGSGIRIENIEGGGLYSDYTNDTSLGINPIKIYNNVPLLEDMNKPPFIARIFTVFPFFVGGTYDKDSNKMTLKEKWGVYDTPIFVNFF